MTCIVILCMVLTTTSCSISNNDTNSLSSEIVQMDVTDTNKVEKKNVFKGAYVNDPIYKNSKNINLFSDNILNFNIVYPADMSEDLEYDVKHSIFAKAREINGERPNYLSDSALKDNGLKSIFVGDTNNSLSAETEKKLKENPSNYFDYIILVKDGNIAINSISDDALNEALKFFCDEILIDEGSTIPDDYYFHYSISGESNFKINNFDITSFAVECYKNPSCIAYRGCEELKAAIKELTDYEIPIVFNEEHTYANRIIVSTVKELKTTEYSIEVSNKDLVILGGSDYSLNAALHKLAMNLKNADSDKTINIPATYSFKGNYDDKTYGTDGYRLVFKDDFDTMNTSLWKPDKGQVLASGHDYTGEYPNVSNGIMSFDIQKTTLKDGSVGSTAMNLVSKGFKFSYGFLEMRAKIPQGPGAWSSFWLVGDQDERTKNGLPEVDIYETFGHVGSITSQLHTWWMSGRKIKGLFADQNQIREGHISHLDRGDTTVTDAFSGGNRFEKPGTTTYADDFHTYGFEWTPSYAKFYMDEYCYLTVDLQSKLIDPVYGYKVAEYLAFSNGTPVMISIASYLNYVDRGFGLKVDSTTPVPTKLQVDYVHLYQLDNLGSVSYR